jgi:hypothetical protein
MLLVVKKLTNKLYMNSENNLKRLPKTPTINEFGKGSTFYFDLPLI